jgi:hypothetical protein
MSTKQPHYGKHEQMAKLKDLVAPLPDEGHTEKAYYPE